MSLKRIYIAEDDRALAELMRVTLSKLNLYDLTFFNNGLDAYRAVQENPPDLLIMDIILPKLDGLAVSKLLKFHEQYRNIPLLIMSSIIDTDIQEQAKKAGADDFLQKPFRPSQIRERVMAILPGECDTAI